MRSACCDSKEIKRYLLGVCVHARMCVTFARMMLTHVNVKIHSAARYRPLVVELRFMCPILASYVDILIFEKLQLVYRSCPGATEAHSQGGGVTVHPLQV